MSDMGVSSAAAIAPRVIEQMPSAAAPAIENTSIPTADMSALGNATPKVDMRASESPMTLSARSPAMLKI